MSGSPYIKEWWASKDAPVREIHQGSDGSSIEEHGYFDVVGGVRWYRAEFRRKVDEVAARTGFDPDGFVRVVIHGGHEEDPEQYEVIAGGDVSPDVAERSICVCGYLLMRGEIEEVLLEVLKLIVDFAHWKDPKYQYFKFQMPSNIGSEPVC